MAQTCERLGAFVALLAFCFSGSLSLVAIFTSHWFDATVLTRNGTQMAGGHINAGLFWGKRTLESSGGLLTEDFSVVTDVRNGISFMARPIWALCIFFAALGMLWVAVGCAVAFSATITRRPESIAGPIGIYLWSLLALVSFGSCLLIYYVQFIASMTENVLTDSYLKTGISTKDQTRLGTSFYLMLASLAMLYFPPTFVFFTHQQQQKTNRIRQYKFCDPNIMMY
ncbi:unnamed protein product, partial [Mesorhabditis spiculigera]